MSVDYEYSEITQKAHIRYAVELATAVIEQSDSDDLTDLAAVIRRVVQIEPNATDNTVLTNLFQGLLDAVASRLERISG
jgi:hypothetical protein